MKKLLELVEQTEDQPLSLLLKNQCKEDIDDIKGSFPMEVQQAFQKNFMQNMSKKLEEYV